VAAVPPLATGAPFSAPAAAVHAGRLFWFGGLDAAGPLGKAFAYEPQGVGRVVPRATLPDGLRVAGASAGTIGDKIYLTGGVLPDRTLSRKTLAYDPTNDTWGAGGFPELAPHRSGMATSVVGDTWYLFGGLGDDRLTAPQSEAGPRPTADASAWKPGFDQSYRALSPMPTPRAGAVAVTVGSKVFVIGGVTRQGALTGAVEAYDAATDRWELRAPLQRPRAYAAAGLVAGAIVVAGGVLGLEPGTDVPVADVEAVTP
jgi:N-acetylneuraminic acid mutarotase